MLIMNLPSNGLFDIRLSPGLETECCLVWVCMRATNCEAATRNEIFPSDGLRPFVTEALC
jgi:hypothetical protein